jgi:membrane glycosyltransferase
MRRAGWEVYMLPELEGSYEECPPTLIDLATRDRRWAQGNLQHSKVVAGKGLSWVSRVHLLQGIMAYLASPLWLMLIVCGLLLSLQAQYATPEYFPDSYVLFPQWPVIDSERALRLFGLTMTVLFLPKVLGALAAMINAQLRKRLGGAGRIITSFVAETVLSALIAPVLMVIQSRFVAEIVAGRDSGWSAQNRDDRDPSWSVVLRRHIGHVYAGVALGMAAAAVSVPTLLWLAPIVMGLAISPLLSWYTAQTSAGIAARRLGLFLIPEETGLTQEVSRTTSLIRIVQPAE